MNSIQEACSSNNPTRLRNALCAGPNPVSKEAVLFQGSLGKNGLHIAAENNNAPIAAILLDAKLMDVNAKTEAGQTALHIAAEKGHFNVLSRLLIEKPDLEIQTKGGKTALELAQENEHEGIATLLKQNGAKETNKVQPAASEKGSAPYFLANTKKTFEKIQQLLSEKSPAKSGPVEVNEVQIQESIPTEPDLHIAIRTNNLEALKTLLDKSAGPNESFLENSALLLAIECKNLEALELLLKAGADISELANPSVFKKVKKICQEKGVRLLDILKEDLWISHRREGAQNSEMINVIQYLKRKTLKTDDFFKICDIYQSLFKNVHLIEPSKHKKLHFLEMLIFERLQEISTDLQKAMQNTLSSSNNPAALNKSANIQKQIQNLQEKIESEKLAVSQKMQGLKENRPKILQQFKHMEERSLKKEEIPLLEVLTTLKSKRLKKLEDELNRLKRNPSIEERLEQIKNELKYRRDEKLRKDVKTRQLIAIGHSMELREAVKKDYIVLNHGQNLDLMFVNLLAKKLQNLFTSQTSDQDVLRHASQFGKIKDIEFFRRDINSSSNRNDTNYSRELLCADIVLHSTKSMSSAIDFFTGTKNIAKISNNAFLKDLLMSIIKVYLPDEEAAKRLYKEIKKIIKNYFPANNLYSICIPKEKFKELCYFSRARGYTRELIQDELHAKIDDMQSGADPCDFPQVRILARAIQAKDGIHVVRHSEFRDEILETIENRVEVAILNALTNQRALAASNPSKMQRL